MADDRRSPNGAQGAGASAGRRVRLGLAAACVLIGAEAHGAAPAFDCGLASDRIAITLKEIGTDATDYDLLQSELNAPRATWATERELAQLSGKRDMLAFIRKTVSGRMAALIKDVGQARSRACLTDEQVADIKARATARAGKILGEQT